ncbi:hypothetical protein JXR93_08965 [bacterium]|nr:hypothetical protein [bacterium]
MRVFVFILLLLSTLIFANNDGSFSYFESFHVEAPEGREVSKVFCDPNVKSRFYYISFDKLYSNSDGNGWETILDLNEYTQEDEEEDVNASKKEELEDALNTLREEIYEEEKAELEDEYDSDDVESDFDDLLQERVDERFEDESESLKEEFKYLQYDEEAGKKTGANPIKNLVFLQNLSSYLIVQTVNGFFVSVDGGKTFIFQDESELGEVGFDFVQFSKTQLLFTSQNRMFIIDSTDKKITKVTLDKFRDEAVRGLDSNFPYLMIQTDEKVHLLKQDDKSLIDVVSIPFSRNVDEKQKIHYFGGKYLFLVSGETVYIFDIMSVSARYIQFPYNTIYDLKYRDEVIYLGTDSGIISFDLNRMVKDNISLGLLPEQAYSISISSDQKIYVSNHEDIYVLREFSSIEELSKDTNLFALMKRISSTYPKIDDLINSAYKYHFIQNEIYNSMLRRNKIAPFMPILKMKYNHQANSRKGIDENVVYVSDETSPFGSAATDANSYFEAFIYFDLSSWIFDIKDMRAHRLNHEKNRVREKLAEEIIYYYNIRQIMEVLYLLSPNIKEKFVFKLKVEEYGALINGLTGRKFF